MQEEASEGQYALSILKDADKSGKAHRRFYLTSRALTHHRLPVQQTLLLCERQAHCMMDHCSAVRHFHSPMGSPHHELYF